MYMSQVQRQDVVLGMPIIEGRAEMRPERG